MIKPLRDKIIVKPEPRIKSSLYIQTAEADTIGVITHCGDDALAEGLNVGDKICFGTLAKNYDDEYLKFESLDIGGERHLKMSWQDVCFVMENEDAPQEIN